MEWNYKSSRPSQEAVTLHELPVPPGNFQGNCQGNDQIASPAEEDLEELCLPLRHLGSGGRINDGSYDGSSNKSGDGSSHGSGDGNNDGSSHGTSDGNNDAATPFFLKHKSPTGSDDSSEADSPAAATMSCCRPFLSTAIINRSGTTATGSSGATATTTPTKASILDRRMLLPAVNHMAARSSGLRFVSRLLTPVAETIRSDSSSPLSPARLFQKARSFVPPPPRFASPLPASSIILVLPDGGIRMLTEPIPVGLLLRDFPPGSALGSVTSGRSTLSLDKVLRLGSTYYVSLPANGYACNEYNGLRRINFAAFISSAGCASGTSESGHSGQFAPCAAAYPKSISLLREECPFEPTQEEIQAAEIKSDDGNVEIDFVYGSADIDFRFDTEAQRVLEQQRRRDQQQELEQEEQEEVHEGLPWGSNGVGTMSESTRVDCWVAEKGSGGATWGSSSSFASSSSSSGDDDKTSNQDYIMQGAATVAPTVATLSATVEGTVAATAADAGTTVGADSLFQPPVESTGDAFAFDCARRTPIGQVRSAAEASAVAAEAAGRVRAMALQAAKEFAEHTTLSRPTTASGALWVSVNSPHIPEGFSGTDTSSGTDSVASFVAGTGGIGPSRFACNSAAFSAGMPPSAQPPQELLDCYSKAIRQCSKGGSCISDNQSAGMVRVPSTSNGFCLKNTTELGLADESTGGMISPSLGSSFSFPALATLLSLGSGTTESPSGPLSPGCFSQSTDESSPSSAAPTPRKKPSRFSVVDSKCDTK